MRLTKIFLIFFIFGLLNSICQGQPLPIGLYEGLMGNSGTASFESTASSFYNPALLSLRQKSSVVLGGNTMSAIISKTNTSDMSGSGFNPTYLSNVDIFDSYAHELFVVNVLDANLISESQESNGKTQFHLRLQSLAAGYSFAFPGFPMGFQTLLYQSSNSGIALLESGTPGSYQNVGHVRVNSRVFHAGIGISTILNFSDYNLGFNFRSRRVKLSEVDKTKYKIYYYDTNTNTLASAEGDNKNPISNPEGTTLTIGNGFRIGAHEFLTDSLFVESPVLDQSYEWRQSYGYRLGLSENHQFLCGLNHLINDKVKYFGQVAYYSTGYSWKTRSYRSSVGVFLWNDKLTQSDQIYGLTFNSEFTY